MALPVFDNANSTQSQAQSVITIPAFLVGGANRLIFVGVGSGSGAPKLTTSVVRNGTETFTEKWDEAAPGSAINLHHSGHYFVAPAAGSFSIVVTLAGVEDDQAAGAVSLKDVDQGAPVGTHGTANGTASPATKTVPATADELLVDNLYAWSADGVIAAGADQTMRWGQEGIGGAVGGGGSEQPGTADDAMSWTFSSGVQWVIGAVPIRGITAIPYTPRRDIAPTQRMA